MPVSKPMHLKRYFFSIFSHLILLFFGFSAAAQNSENLLSEQLQKISKNYNTDAVYLQTSKNIYETEEDLWFKAYVLDAQHFTPSSRSKILFVQLIEDKTDKVVWEKKYEIENGFVNGHLFLKNDLAEGIYTLAAYSKYSFSSNTKEFYAAKKIEIQKTIKRKTAIEPIQKDNSILFTTYPEGGKLVSRIRSVLAFKAVNSKGLPVTVSGTLFENNVPLIPLMSSHAGMGAIEFTPDNTKKYHIELSEPTENKRHELPVIQNSGRVLSLIDNNKEALIFKITQTDDLKEEKVYLRLQMRGVVYNIATGILKKELYLKIPLNDTPQGIAELTLFDGNAHPLAERLVYVNQEQKLTIKTELDKSAYTTREKANLKIKVTDEKGQAIVAHLGLSVYDGIYQNKLDSKNIQSHYLLSTQLKGNIYDPAYYFKEENKDRKQALNLLMLTQGWRNYIWNESNLKEQGNNVPIVFDEMKAKVLLVKSKKNIVEVSGKKLVFVTSADESRGHDFITTDSTGVLSIGPKDLKMGEGGYTYLQIKTPPPTFKPRYRMDIKNIAFEEINKQRKDKSFFYPIPKFQDPNEKAADPFMDRITVNKLKEVVITSKNNNGFRDKYIGKLDSLYRANHFTGDYVCTRSGYLNCQFCLCQDSHTGKPVEGKWYIYMNGFRWLRTNTACTGLTPYTLDKYDNNQYHYPDLTEAELLEMFNVVMIEGYYGKKVFYEAVYDEVTINDSTPDYRNTLYWKPDIITNKDGEASVNFFCSDINSLFLGSIEGVSGNGLLGAESFEFKVVKKGN